MTTVRSRLDLAAVALIVMLCALWGANQVAVKVTNAGISPVLQAGLRSVGSGLLVLAWARARGVALFGRDGTLGPGLLAGLLFALEFALMYVALQYTSASRTVIFLYTAPFFVAAGSHFLIAGGRLRVLQVVGLALAFAGVVAALADHLGAPAGSTLAGDALALAAGAIWGATTVIVKATRLARASPDKTLAYQLVVSAIVLPPASLALGEPGVIALTPTIVALMAFQIVIVAFASYLAWFWLLQRYPAANVSAFTFLTPILGVIAGAVLLREPLTAPLLAAVVLVAAGLYLVNRPPAATSAAAMLPARDRQGL